MFGKRLGVFFLLLSLADFCSALSFEPTTSEWKTWPGYCKARYTVSGSGTNSVFGSAVSQAKVEQWHSRLASVWKGLHHYCAGVVLFNRAKQSPDPVQRSRQLQQAIREASYTIERSDPTHPLYAKMLTLRARAKYELGQRSKAFDDLKLAIRLHGKVAAPYSAMGFMLREAGEPKKALEVLERGEAESGGSAELHYFQGIILAELKRYPRALEQAKLAYKKGYPLPGLKRKLRAAGHWN